MSAIRNPIPLSHALAHHGKVIEPVVGVLAIGIILNLQPLGWQLKQIRTGARSFVLYRGVVEYHFRPGYDAATNSKIERIDVYDNYRRAVRSLVAQLDGRVAAIRFIDMIVAQG